MINIKLRDAEKLEGEDKSLFISFNYNPDILKKIKTIKPRAYHFDTKDWELGQEGIHNLLELFSKNNLNIDDDVDLKYTKEEVELNNECKWSIFNPLLETMPKDVCEFTIEILKGVPDYFYTIPASKSGRYHPSYALGEGGTLRHTLAVGLIALELFRNNTICSDFSNREKHLMLSASILHDTFKQGKNGGKYVTEHPVLASKFIHNFEQNILSMEEVNIICDCISTHMGEWTYDYKLKKDVLTKPITEMQKFVHLCDYLASRKMLEVNFEVVE